jgi:hypothetical protein
MAGIHIEVWTLAQQRNHLLVSVGHDGAPLLAHPILVTREAG